MDDNNTKRLFKDKNENEITDEHIIAETIRDLATKQLPKTRRIRRKERRVKSIVSQDIFFERIIETDLDYSKDEDNEYKKSIERIIKYISKMIKFGNSYESNDDKKRLLDVLNRR